MPDREVRTHVLPDKGNVKEFYPKFDICEDSVVHTVYTYQDVNAIGLQGVDLVKLVAQCKGVRGMTISKHTLHVVKYEAFPWDEVTREIENAFRVIFGNDIKFIDDDSQWSLKIGPLNITLKS